MDWTEPLGPELKIDELGLKLQFFDTRVGRCIDIYTQNIDGKDKTILRFNIYAEPPGQPKIVLASDAPPNGKKLDFAGTAFIEGERKIVAIYR